MQSGLPADAASLRETASGIHRVGPCVPSNSIASCGAVSCLINTLADGAEGLHFSVIRLSNEGWPQDFRRLSRPNWWAVPHVLTPSPLKANADILAAPKFDVELLSV